MISAITGFTGQATVYAGSGQATWCIIPLKDTISQQHCVKTGREILQALFYSGHGCRLLALNPAWFYLCSQLVYCTSSGYILRPLIKCRNGMSLFSTRLHITGFIMEATFYISIKIMQAH